MQPENLLNVGTTTRLKVSHLIDYMPNNKSWHDTCLELLEQISFSVIVLSTRHD